MLVGIHPLETKILLDCYSELLIFTLYYELVKHSYARNKAVIFIERIRTSIVPIEAQKILILVSKAQLFNYFFFLNTFRITKRICLGRKIRKYNT